MGSCVKELARELLASMVVLSIVIPMCYTQGTTSVNLLVAPVTQSGEEGTEFTFNCTGPAGTSLKWFRKLTNSTEVQLVSDSQYAIEFSTNSGMTSGTLTIKNAQSSDNGSYICKQDSNEFEVTLKVFTAVDVEIIGDTTFVENANLMLSCLVDGATNSTVQWMVNKTGMLENLVGGDDESHIQVLPNNTLIVRKMTLDDAGIYICKRLFSGGSKTATANVGGEITLTAPKSVKYTEGDRAFMECEAKVITSALLPNITWMVDGEDIPLGTTDRYTVEEPKITQGNTITSKLEIVSITMADRRNYTCIATNTAGSDSADILLRVRDRLAALWPFIGIVSEVVLLIVIIFVHEKCSKGEDFGEDDEDDEDEKKEKKEKISDGEGDIRMRATKE